MRDIVEINGVNDLTATLKSLISSPNSKVLYDIKLHSLPDFELYLKGDKFDNSITPSIMEGIVELQKAINRTYCLIKYKDDNLNYLSDSERRQLELKVVVKPGSSQIITDITGIGKTLLEMTKSMSSNQNFVIILAFLLTVCFGVGYLYFDSYIKHLALKENTSKEIVIERERTKQMMAANQSIVDAARISHEIQHINTSNSDVKSSSSDAIEQMPKEESNNTDPDSEINNISYFKPLQAPNNEAVEALESAKQSSHKAKLAISYTEESLRTLMAKTSNADFVRFNNQFEASGYTMKQISKSQPTVSEDLVISEPFRVLNVDTKKSDYMQAKLRPTQSEYPEFIAKFTDTSISKDKINKLTTALTSYHPIELSISARNRKGRLHNAVIAQVRELDTSINFKEPDDDSNA